MPSLETIEKKHLVKVEIIDKMISIYTPPKHMDGNAEAQAEYLGSFVNPLSYYSREDLKAGWEEVKANKKTWVWPTVEEVVSAVRSRAKRPAPAHAGNRKMPWEEAQAKAEQLWKSYLSEWVKNSSQHSVATHQGWAKSLEDWVCAAAWLQAQVIAGVKNRSVDWRAMLCIGSADDEGRQKEVHRQTRNAMETGNIHVVLPEWAELELKQKAGAQPF